MIRICEGEGQRGAERVRIDVTFVDFWMIRMKLFREFLVGMSLNTQRLPNSQNLLIRHHISSLPSERQRRTDFEQER